jgi:hypothetical protein
VLIGPALPTTTRNIEELRCEFRNIIVASFFYSAVDIAFVVFTRTRVQ